MSLKKWIPDFKALQPSFDLAIAEDIGDGDHSALSCLSTNKRGKVKLLAKENGIIAGVALSQYLFTYIDPSAVVRVFIEDGCLIHKGDIVLEVEGNSIKLLQAERLVLNYVLTSFRHRYEYFRIRCVSGSYIMYYFGYKKTTPGLSCYRKMGSRIRGR